MGFRQSISNFFSFTPKGAGNAQSFIRNAGGSDDPRRNLNMNIFPTSFERARTDLESVANALKEAEVAGWPFRVELQKLYEKCLQNAHVAACVQRRKELTLLRDFQIQDAKGVADKEWTEYFEKAWFRQQMLHHILNAIYHGFSLISIGEIKDDVPDLITNIKRWNVSPDRRHVSVFEKSPNGYCWDDAPYRDWHIWVPTLQENGINNCGYGLLLVTSILEILQRNNVQYNADFVEMFASPFRWLKTNDTDGDEYKEKEKALRDMGHNAYLITGLTDELEFLNDGQRGNGYKSYNDFDHRIKSDISKWIGGHADFIDSTPRALGDKQNSGGGDITDDATGNSQVQKALAAKRAIDGDFVMNVVNEQLIPKLRKRGIRIPEGHKLVFLNDSEQRAIAAQEADKNQKVATLALSFAQAGLRMKKEYAEKATGIQFDEIEIAPDKNVLKDEKEQAAGKEPLKNGNMQREQTPKHTT
jgi:hypothetical protein